MSLFDRILARARGQTAPKQKALYDLHPELLERIPILRISSEQEASGTSTTFHSQAGFYETNVWVHKAVRVWADNISPLRVRVVRGEGRDADEIENHPVGQLLANPNPDQSSASLWREWATDMALGGEWGLELVKSASKTKYLELWPRQPQDFSVAPGQMGKRYRRVDHYKIEDGEGQPYNLTPEEFIHFKFYNPLNIWRGIAPMTAARTGATIYELAQAWERLFFQNQARPDFAIIAPEGITRSEKEEMYVEIDQRTRGRNVHRPLILEQGVTDIKTFSFAPKDMEWVNQMQFSRDEVGGIFGVPDEIMGYGKDTYENFDTADRVLWTLTLVNLVRLRDGTLTRFFRRVRAISDQESIETDVSMVPQLQEDKSQKLTQWDMLVNRGVPGNVASEYLGLGLPDYPAGRVGYLPFGVVPVGSTRAPVSLVNDPEPEDDPGEPVEELSFGRRKAVPEYGSPEHVKLWETKQSRLDDPVDEMQRILKKEFQRQQTDVDQRLRNNRNFGRGHYKDDDRIPPVEELFDYESEVQKFIKALGKTIETAIDLVGLASAQEVFDGSLFDITRPEVQAGIREVLEAVSRKVNETTWTNLVEIFQEAEQAGEGIVKIQERLSSYFGDRKSDWQTERIARTTMTGATGFADVEAWSQTGVVSRKTWISALIPDRTRDAHAAAHGQTVGLRENFTVDGEYLMYPGDPQGNPGNIINCLCVQVANVME